MSDVYYNYGRWVVACPSIDCLGAEKVEPGQREISCRCRPGSVCQHGVPCGEPIRLDWPTNYQEIEHLVRNRPVQNRNWVPGEPVENLKRENLLKGVKS